MSDQELLPEEYLKFFKAMADANRLRILGLLAMEPLSVEQLAAMLKLKPSTVSHHLAKLADVNLVSAKAYSYYNIYQLENSTLESMASQLLSREALPTMAEDIDLDAYDRKVLADYSTPDGKLKNIPAQRKKLDDTATLRRELVGARLLARSKDGREYWRVEEKI
jgi:DNA-binding transcriptional ArsR family regulator